MEAKAFRTNAHLRDILSAAEALSPGCLRADNCFHSDLTGAHAAAGAKQVDYDAEEED